MNGAMQPSEGTGGVRRFLWAVPRSGSTAFERWVIERGDHAVIDEPFSAVYYLGPERVSPRYRLEEPASTGARVLADVRNAPTPLFVKDMAHHVPHALWNEVADMGCHTILVRDPRRAIPSFAKVWPDVTWEECGYEALVKFLDRLTDRGRRCAIVDADDLMRAPRRTLEAWCEGQGLAFDPATLRWQPGLVPQWTRWLDFHANAIESDGLHGREPGPFPEVTSARIRNLVERANPFYEALVERHKRW